MVENGLRYSSTSFALQRQDNPALSDVRPFGMPGFLFNDAQHLHQQADGSYTLLTATALSTGITQARCALFTDGRTGVVTSPIAAPFGSIEFSEDLPDPVLDQLLDAVIETARQADAPSLRIVSYPHCYAPVQAKRLTDKLPALGFQITESAVNQYVPVTDKSFTVGLAHSERRRLAKCRRAGFRFRQRSNSDLQTVIGFLTETRRVQNYPLPIPPNRLAHLLQLFPAQFKVFMVTDGPTIAALVITVRVRHDILYTFLPASNPDYRLFSPMVLLIDGLYQYCQEEHIPILDLGLSLGDNRQPKPSLMRFKQKLGALESTKLTFEKVFSYSV